MSSIDFPSNPAVGQRHIVGLRTWQWTGSTWDAVTSAAGILSSLYAFTHTQLATSSQWTINHNLGFNPQISIRDNNGQIIEGQITYNNLNTITLDFSIAISGTAYLS
jgi:hypothetical protein